ncbi:MAG: hypothetical protein C7N36_03730 [Bacteroidetes bacterium]|nr:MAG: hypothetical protein C7N36_03730 [Bacteroidota bacterium]
MKEMSNCFYAALVLFFLLPPSFAAAQPDMPYFQDFTLEDGLSSTDITDFYQDSRGIVWFATSYGLNRYDGTTIKSYTKEDNGLCHNYIQRIAEDGKGNLWVMGGDFGTQNAHFCIFDPFTECFFSIEEYTGERCPFDPNQTQMYGNYQGTFLLMEKKGIGLQFYEVRQDKIERGFTFPNQDSLIHVNTRFLAFKLDEETYVAGMALRTDPYLDVTQNVYHLKSAGSIAADFLVPNPAAFNSVAAEVLVTSEQKMQYLFQSYHRNTVRILLFLNEKYSCTTVPNDTQSQSRLFGGKLYNLHQDHLEIFTTTPDALVREQRIDFGEHAIVPLSSYLDRSGNIWFENVDAITKVSFQRRNFKLHLADRPNNRPIPVRGITSTPDGTIYVGDLINLEVKPKGRQDISTAFENKDLVSLLGILYDEGKIWLATEFIGLMSYDLTTKSLISYGRGLLWQPYKAANGSIWVGGGKGLFQVDTQKKELLPFRDYGVYAKLEKSAVYAFHTNEKGTWLATSSGLYLVDLNQQQVLAHYSDTQKPPFYLPANHIAHLYEDQEGIFWLASKGQGLVRWNPATGESEQLTKGNAGLSHNVLYAVYEDDFGNLWLPSNYGLNCLNKTTRQVSLYLKEDGLPNNEFNTTSHHQDKFGNLYFGTVDGMIEFHPKDFQQETEDVPFLLTAVHRIDRQTDSIINMTRSVLADYSLTITPDDKAVDFSFALLDYKKAKGNQYSYKIVGYRDEWTYQKEASVRISGLPYGNYQLLFRGKASGSNRWMEYPYPITIRVAKPFYLQGWFLLSCLLTLIGGVYLVIKRNTRKLLARQDELEVVVQERTEEIRLQAEELKQLDKVKSNFFANISHELRTPLTLILGPLSYILESPAEWEKEDMQKQLLVMQRNGKSLMQLIEEILDLSKLEANKLELEEEPTPVVSFFEHLFFVFEPQFQSQGLEYELVLDVKEDLHVLLDRKKMEKVLNNFLGNAIKFTNRYGKIVLRVTETDSQLKIKITDNGKGIHPKDLPYIFERFYQSKQADQQLYGGTGIGLALVNEFAQLMGGKAYADSTLGEGSNFYFELPKKVVAPEKMLPQAKLTDLVEVEEIYAIGSDFTILIVEDNQDMRNFIHQLLKPKYQRIFLANNGAEGLLLLQEHGTAIDLIVSDVMMPEVDGLTMLREIKTHPEWYGIPVVMLTALAADRDRLTALTIGVDDYLTKPFSVSELLIRVQNLLFNFQQRKEWKASAEFHAELPRPEENDTSAPINAEDKGWLDELKTMVVKVMEDTVLDVESLAAAAFMSPRQLNRKLKTLTGLSPNKFIKEVQLQTAREILENRTSISIAEVAHKVGFEHPSSFSRIFKDRFGKTPSDYLN